jgi:hypothetical protein
LLVQLGEVIVVVDPGGRRVGSGRSTICCLMEVLGREIGDHAKSLGDSEHWKEIFRRLPILIIHAGGDCRGLPA